MYRTRCLYGKDAHTTHEHGTGELGCSGSDLGRCAGAGGGSGGGDVPGIRGMGWGDDDLWAGLRNHPTTLTASWWAGYSGREGGGEGRATGRSPGADSGEEKGVLPTAGSGLDLDLSYVDLGRSYISCPFPGVFQI